MAEGPGYQTSMKRRRKRQTDYRKRLELLKSGHPRAVIRVSNNNTRTSLVRYHAGGDETVTDVHSGTLDRFGWDGHTGNLPAAYLTGLLAGYMAKEEGIDSAVADLGPVDREQGSRHYAAVKGLQDAGLDLPAGEDAFPSEDRIRGAHIGEETEEMFETTRAEIESEHGDQ